jgi:putative (di)nucleoside polyphosphate hydrolase
MSEAKSLPYRQGVGIMLLNARGLVFVGHRIDTVQEAWQMPQGGMDPGERPRETALRELEEETGIAPDKVEFLAESRDWLRYDVPPELVGKVWKGRYRGQEQKWFAARFTGVDADVNIATEHPEFRAWRWLSPSALPDAIVPFKIALYERVLEEFSAFVTAD